MITILPAKVNGSEGASVSYAVVTWQPESLKKLNELIQRCKDWLDIFTEFYGHTSVALSMVPGIFVRFYDWHEWFEDQERDHGEFPSLAIDVPSYVEEERRGAECEQLKVEFKGHPIYLTALFVGIDDMEIEVFLPEKFLKILDSSPQ